MFYKVMAIGDLHDDPHQTKERFTWLGEHLLATKPDYCISIGDWVTLDSLNTHVGNETLAGSLTTRFFGTKIISAWHA